MAAAAAELQPVSTANPHQGLSDLIRIVQRPVVRDDSQATTSERVRGEWRVRRSELPGVDLSQFDSVRTFEKHHPLGTSRQRAVLLLPINYMNTQLAIPSPLTDAMCVGQLFQSRGWPIFHLCNASAIMWKTWFWHFLQTTDTELVVFCDCHGYDVAHDRPPALLGFPKAAASGPSAFTNLYGLFNRPGVDRTRQITLTSSDLITSEEVQDLILKGRNNGTCRVIMIADCCHGASVFGPAIEMKLDGVWFVLASEKEEVAQIRRVMGVFSFFLTAILQSEPDITFSRLKQRLDAVLPGYKQHAVIAGCGEDETICRVLKNTSKVSPPEPPRSGAVPPPSLESLMNKKRSGSAAVVPVAPVVVGTTTSEKAAAELYGPRKRKPRSTTTTTTVVTPSATTSQKKEAASLYAPRRHSIAGPVVIIVPKPYSPLAIVAASEASSLPVAASSLPVGREEGLYPQRVGSRNPKIEVQRIHGQQHESSLQHPLPKAT